MSKEGQRCLDAEETSSTENKISLTDQPVITQNHRSNVTAVEVEDEGLRKPLAKLGCPLNLLPAAELLALVGFVPRKLRGTIEIAPLGYVDDLTGPDVGNAGNYTDSIADRLNISPYKVE